MPTRLLPFAPFEPDKSLFNPNASDVILNALPSADGWRWMPSKDIFSEALPAPCIGAIMHKAVDGTVTVFAATRTNLYRLDSESWTEVSKSTDAYSAPDGEEAAFLTFGNIVYVNNLGTTPQKYVVGTDSAFSDVADMPQAKYMWTAGDYVVCGHLLNEPNLIAWSGLNDGDFWTYGERGSDQQEIPAGGEIQGGLGDQRGAIVMLRDRMVFMQLAPGTGLTFTITPANEARGVVAPYSIAQIGPGRFCYLSEDGFFMGAEGRAIGAKRVDRWFLERMDQAQLYTVKAVVDPFEKIVWWQYTKTDGEVELLGWDWQLDKWCRSDLNIQTAARLATAAMTVDGQTGLVDDDMTLVDARSKLGGRPAFAVFDVDNKMAFLTGSGQAATLETADVELAPGRRSFVREGRLIGHVQTYTAQTGGRNHHGDGATWKSAVNPSSRSKLLPFRHSARTHSVRLNIEAGQSWSDVSGVYVDFEPEGRA